MTEFLKMHGCGNDFIIIDLRKGADKAVIDTPAFIKKASDRHFGVGCDQFIMIAAHPDADGEMLIRNSDGSVAGMCGNATRCVADILMQETGKDAVTIMAGPRTLQCWREGADIVVDMGAPNTVADVTVLPALPTGTSVDMGNPHVVFFVADADTADVAGLGPLVETHPLFPNRTNVEFVSRTADGLRMRVWERGAGITLACGSGACATIVAAVTKGMAPRKCAVRMDGGTLRMEWRESDGHVLMAGPASYVFKGILADR
ncbi:MAG: diaminopimelate epimerase [Alphaproteobacteria bacterium]|nr:diaminopimelate epimerase [Alphaproteobacteria bacterium]